MGDGSIHPRGAGAPLVSIGMPVHNAERHLATAVESVLAQSFGDFELIISDNASTDGTEQIVQRYLQRDARIRYQRFDTNRGVAHNWNAVMRAARGRYFKWLAGSDAIAPDLLERCVQVLRERDDVVLVFGRTRWIDDAGTPHELCELDFAVPHASPAARFGCVVNALSVNNQINAGLIRTSALRRTALLGNYPSSDLVLMAELALQGPFVLLPQELLRRRRGPEVSTPERTPLQAARMYRHDAVRPYHWLPWRRQLARYAACLRAPLPWHQQLGAMLVATGVIYRAWLRRGDRARRWLSRALAR
jgi:glycosyltransferase involved in cell wall biosynthesis